MQEKIFHFLFGLNLLHSARESLRGATLHQNCFFLQRVNHNHLDVKSLKNNQPLLGALPHSIDHFTKFSTVTVSEAASLRMTVWCLWIFFTSSFLVVENHVTALSLRWAFLTNGTLETQATWWKIIKFIQDGKFLISTAFSNFLLRKCCATQSEWFSYITEPLGVHLLSLHHG